MSVYSPAPISNGNHPPAGSFNPFAPRNTSSSAPKIPHTNPARHKDQPQTRRAAPKSNTVVMSMVSDTAMP